MRLIALLLTLIALAVPAAAQMSSAPLETTPTPDPTRLTTAALREAIAGQRELFDAKVLALTEELKLQKMSLDATDARLILRLDGIPGLIDTAVVHLQKLMEEKFRGVDQQFQGRDVALAAALLAQKTSVDEQNKANAASSAKAEGATTKQIDGIQSIILANGKATDDKIEGVKALLASQARGVDDKIADLRNTVADIRTALSAYTARGAGQSDLWAYIVAAAGVLIAVLAFAFPRQAVASHPHYYREPYQQQPMQQPQVAVVPVVPVPVPPNGGGR